MPLETWNTIAQVGLFFATLILAYIAYYQVNKVRGQSNADFILRLNREFFYESQTNRNLVKAIEKHEPVLKENHGEFDEYDIYGYLRYFEMIERFIDAGIVSFDLVDEMFGAYIARAWENVEIRSYVVWIRKERKDDRYFEHFEQLAKDILEREKKFRV
jgi:hypothetical protein